MKILKSILQKKQLKEKVPVESILKEINVRLCGYAEALKAASLKVNIN